MKVATGAQPGRHDHPAHSLHFFRHLVEMLLVMMVGMMASAAVFLSADGMTVDETLRRHAVLFVVAQAFGMTVAMVAWMRYRGHAWRGCSEMAAAMVIPAIPLICLRLLDVISGPICGAYCALTLVAMVGVMLSRRSDYGEVHAAGAPRPLRSRRVFVDRNAEDF